ncbi:MAG: ion channel [Methylophaga sp.]|nr:ion channel [Methylophaga sp.]
MTPEIILTLITAAVVGIVVVFHYEVIKRLDSWSPRQAYKQHGLKSERPIILIMMFTLLFAHIVEIWLFGIAFWWLLKFEGIGQISGYPDLDLLDCVYFSAATYTTVGWGDLTAIGHIRFLAGTVALVGFMMITWSASFGYLIMARAFGDDSD